MIKYAVSHQRYLEHQSEAARTSVQRRLGRLPQRQSTEGKPTSQNNKIPKEGGIYHILPEDTTNNKIRFSSYLDMPGTTTTIVKFQETTQVREL